jgi:hypothetical protein
VLVCVPAGPSSSRVTGIRGTTTSSSRSS